MHERSKDSQSLSAEHATTGDLLPGTLTNEGVTEEVSPVDPEESDGMSPEHDSRETQVPQDSRNLEKNEKNPSKMTEEELLDWLDLTIPQQYRLLPPETLEMIWSPDDVPYYIDDPTYTRRNAEIRKRRLALVVLNDFLPEARKVSRHNRLAEIGKKAQIADIKARLSKETISEIPEETENYFASSSLDQLATHYFESPEQGVSVLHSNEEHGQDAFAINLEKGVFCVSDGASSYGQSGPVSNEFSRGLVEEASSGKPLDEIFSEANIGRIAQAIKESDSFKNFSLPEHSRLNRLNREAGLATLLLARVDKEKRLIEWASVGDSPLIVLDRNPDGSYSFEIVNDDVDGVKFTDKNFTEEKMADSLADPETFAVGIGRDGNPRLDGLKKLRQGKIDYQEGRVVMLASDFLTKMMALSPQMMEAKILKAQKAGKNLEVEAWKNYLQKAQGANNPLSQKRFKPESFFDGTLSPDELKEALENWKKMDINVRGLDDMTAVCIKMDTLI